MAYQHKTDLNLLIEAGHHSPQQVLHDVSEIIIIVVNVNVNLCTMFLPVFILTTAVVCMEVEGGLPQVVDGEEVM